MADHRVNDLSYGHLGKATYGTETKEWSFSVTQEQDTALQQLLPVTVCFASSTHQGCVTVDAPPAPQQLTWLSKVYPEAFAAKSVTLNLLESPSITPFKFQCHYGTLLTIGRAVDADRISGSRKPRIIATASGGAGHILRLLKPRIESRGWGKQSGVKISLLDPKVPEEGHWVSSGGTIYQVTSAEGVEDSATWLAVRQASTITIFRPLYGRLHHPALPANGDYHPLVPSRVNPNPVAVLQAEQTGSKTHVDISFNPWYSRQFSVVDSAGHWSIWELETAHQKGVIEILVPRKSGNIYDDYKLRSSLEELNDAHFDGWYRVLWICNINTIVVCNRHHLAIFDMKGKPARLETPKILTNKRTEWILDIKISLVNRNHLVLLTTTRIFWIEVVPAVEATSEPNVFAGAKILLSYRHFRAANDESLKLTVIKDENLSAIITSSQIIDSRFYSFWINTSGTPTSQQGSFTCYFDSGSHRNHSEMTLHSLCFLPTPLLLRGSSRTSGTELQYLDRGVKFFQVWTLTSDLGLGSTIFASQRSNLGGGMLHRLSVTAPSTRLRGSHRHMLPGAVSASFIVPDRLYQDENGYETGRGLAIRGEVRNVLGSSLNWRNLFRRIFLPNNNSYQLSSQSVEGRTKLPSMTDLLSQASDRLVHGLEEDTFVSKTLLEVCGLTGFSGDLEEASTVVRGFLESLSSGTDKSPLHISKLVIADVSASLKFPKGQNSQFPDLLNIYDYLVEYWMTSLPLSVSSPSRHSKFKIIRQLAVELCLSSVEVSLQASNDHQSEIVHATSEIRSMQGVGSLKGTEIPKLARNLKEDPAISRLRQYAVSIRSKPDLGESDLLKRWTLGADPAKYQTSTTVTVEEVEEEIVPKATHPFSSQRSEDLPMTQPERGVFGSRTRQKTKKQKKPRTAGFR